MRELVADLFLSLDGFASGTDEAAYFGYFGQDLGNWVREDLNERQVLLMGRVTYEALARFAVSCMARSGIPIRLRVGRSCGVLPGRREDRPSRIEPRGMLSLHCQRPSRHRTSW